ncbi:MAG: nitrogen fixation protein FixH [Paracoccaceae bacterium]|jgi:nitrogen fixation protein FixH
MIERRKLIPGFRPPLTGRHVLAIIVTFFLVIFAANGVFVYVSLQSHPGVTSDDAYRKGLDHNRTLDHAARQNARGWTARVVAADGRVEVLLADRSGAALTGLSVRGEARRPIHDRSDTELTLRETAPGQYNAVGTKLSSGRWALVLTAAADGLPVYRIEYDVVVR